MMSGLGGTRIVSLAGVLAMVILAAGVDARDPRSRATDPDEPRRVALLIGVADYQHFNMDGPAGQTDLRGTRNDVERISRSLERFGFVGDDVRILLDADASKAGVTAAFEWLAERAREPEDSVVIFFSGHGSYAEDRDGDEAEVTSGDTRDEGLVPWDARDIHDPDQLVLDDEIRAWLGAIPTNNVTIIVDACYSGTVTRGSVSETPKGPLAPGDAGTAIDLVSPRHTLITAASPAQQAFEWQPSGEDLVYGKLTYHLTRSLDEADSTTRYDEIMRRVQRDVSSSGSASNVQTPQLEGDRSARLFHVQGDVPRRAFVTVVSSGETVEIDAGAVHGVRRSATYDVFPPDETQFSGEALATIQVDSVDLGTSRAVLVKGTRIPSGGRAVLSLVPPGAERVDAIEVFLDEGAEELAPVVESLAFANVTSEGIDADARISRSGEGVVVWVGADSLPPQKGDVDTGLTAGPDGAYLGTTEALCRPLRRAFSIASFDALENPVEDPGWVEVQIAVTEPGEAPPQHVSFLPDTLVIGQPYNFWARVDADEGQELYLTIAIEGYTSEPAVYWPDEQEMNQPVPLNNWIRLNRRPVQAVEPAGSEHLIAVIGPTQFDLHSLIRSFPTCEGGVRGEGPEKFETVNQPVTSWQTFRQLLVLEEP